MDFRAGRAHRTLAISWSIARVQNIRTSRRVRSLGLVGGGEMADAALPAAAAEREEGVRGTEMEGGLPTLC